MNYIIIKRCTSQLLTISRRNNMQLKVNLKIFDPDCVVYGKRKSITGMIELPNEELKFLFKQLLDELTINKLGPNLPTVDLTGLRDNKPPGELETPGINIKRRIDDPFEAAELDNEDSFI